MCQSELRGLRRCEYRWRCLWDKSTQKPARFCRSSYSGTRLPRRQSNPNGGGRCYAGHSSPPKLSAAHLYESASLRERQQFPFDRSRRKRNRRALKRWRQRLRIEGILDKEMERVFLSWRYYTESQRVTQCEPLTHYRNSPGFYAVIGDGCEQGRQFECRLFLICFNRIVRRLSENESSACASILNQRKKYPLA